MDKVKQWMYYFIIGLVSLIALCFLPMIGSDVGLDWNLPNTVVGWIVWITVKLIVAVLNVLIFHCFMLQAKINIKDNERYQEALEILRLTNQKDFIPRSPAVWNKQQYSHKGITIFITTGLSTIALTQAMLTFDWMAMLTYLFTIVMGLMFGIMQMKVAEDYWTDEFWQYAQKVKRDMELAEKEYIYKRNDSTCDHSRDNILDSSMGTSNIGTSDRPQVVDSVDGCNYVLGGAIYSGCTVADGVYSFSRQDT